MHFNPPQNDKTSPFFHPLNRVNEEVKTIDKKKAKDIYDKLKKGSEIEVNFGNSFTRGGTPITLKVTSGHRVVGASRVGRIILVNKENPRGMKYKLFDRNGSVSLAQGDMGTILRDMKIVKEGVEELDEAVKTKVEKTSQGFQVMVFSPTVKKFIPQGSPHKTKAAAEKDAKMFEDVQLDETVRTMFKGFGREATEFQTKLKKSGFDKDYRKMMQNFIKRAKPGDGFYVTMSDNMIDFQIHPVADMMMGAKIKKLGDKDDLGEFGTRQLIAIKEDVQVNEMSPFNVMGGKKTATPRKMGRD